jgi:hypothetical protein
MICNVRKIRRSKIGRQIAKNPGSRLTSYHKEEYGDWPSNCKKSGKSRLMSYHKQGYDPVKKIYIAAFSSTL